MPNRGAVPNRRTVLAALAAVPLLAACSPGLGSKAPELALDKVWDKAVPFDAGLGIDYLVARLSLLGNHLLHAEGNGTQPDKITALDTATGTQRWSIGVGESITAPTVGRVLIAGCGMGARSSFNGILQNPVLKSAGDILPVSYVSGSEASATTGVIGLSLQTGRPIWGIAATSEPSPIRAVITAVSDAVMIITVAPTVGPDWPAADSALTMIAVDPATGEKLWEGRDLYGFAVGGEFVIAAKRASGGTGWTAQVLDARTGESRWADAPLLDHPSDHVATAAGYTVFRPSRSTKGKYQVLQLSSGRLIDYPEDYAPRPLTTEPPLLAWDTGDEFWSPWSSGFYTQQLPAGNPEHGRGRPGGLDFTPAIGVGPHIWGSLTGTQGTWEHDAHFIGIAAVDRTGTPRSPSVKGLLAGASDRWLVVVDSLGFAVHRIASA